MPIPIPVSVKEDMKLLVLDVISLYNKSVLVFKL